MTKKVFFFNFFNRRVHFQVLKVFLQVGLVSKCYHHLFLDHMYYKFNLTPTQQCPVCYTYWRTGQYGLLINVCPISRSYRPLYLQESSLSILNAREILNSHDVHKIKSLFYYTDVQM